MILVPPTAAYPEHMKRVIRERGLADRSLKKGEQPNERKPYTAVPRFLRITEQQIDRTAEVKPLPPQVPERND